MLRIIFFVLLIPSLCFGANYYVDPDYNGSNGTSNGSFSRPWTSIGQVNSYGGFATSDGLYFREGTTLLMTAAFSIRWGGTAQARAIIGAYHISGGQPVHALSSTNRPILDGQGHTIPAPGATLAAWGGLVEHNLPSTATVERNYITVRDLHIRDSGGVGIRFQNSTAGLASRHHLVHNCEVTRPWRQGILIARTGRTTVSNNIVNYSSYGNWRLHPVLNTRAKIGGAGIETTAMNQPGRADHNTVNNNIVHNGQYEGIGVYKMAGYTVVADNITYDSAVNIYIGRVQNVDVYNNLVYRTANAVRGFSRGIAGGLEMEVASYEEVRAVNWRIHGNYIAATSHGIELIVYSTATVGYENVWIYNNRIVDAITSNFRFARSNLGDWNDIWVYNNYSFLYAGTGAHTDDDSPHGTTWNRTSTGANTPNYFTGGALPGGNAANHPPHAQLGVAELYKTTGWRNLEPGIVEKTIFSFVGEDITGVFPEKVESANPPKKVSNFQIKQVK